MENQGPCRQKKHLMDIVLETSPGVRISLSSMPFFSFLFFLLLIVSRKTDTKFFFAPSAWLFNSACPACVPFPAPLTYMT